MSQGAKRFSFIFVQLCAFAGLVGPTGCGRSPQENVKFDSSLMRRQPDVAEVSIQILTTLSSEGNARLRVRYKENLDRKTLPIQSGDHATLLRDDGLGADERAGDGVYSALVNFDAREYTTEQRRRAARKLTEVPVFKGRALVGKKRVEASVNISFDPGIVVSLPKYDADPSAVDPTRELLITNLNVVEDPSRTYNPCTNTGTPMGPWTFGKLMTEMANEPVTGINPSDFTLHWLQEWSTDQTINTFTVGQRTSGLNERILNPWPKLPDGKLDLAKAPFRLLAIVNRIDLRGSTAYGSSDAGEARMVYGLVLCNAVLPQHEVQPFTVIFEYGIKKTSCLEVRDWAQQWQALGTMVLGSPTYNTALEAITNQFTLRNADPAKMPNRSALNQLRTNEFAIATFPADSFWELREFRICADSGICNLGQLEEVTIAQTPDVSFQATPAQKLLLRDFVNNNENDVLDGTHAVPLQLPPMTPFRAGAVQPGAGFPWNPGGITNLEARHKFSLATCNGCHTSETGTQFLHIAPRNTGSEAMLSDFLTGLNQPTDDPVNPDPMVTHTFHDLLDRQMKLDATANMNCRVPIEDLFQERFLPPVFVH